MTRRRDAEDGAGQSSAAERHSRSMVAVGITEDATRVVTADRTGHICVRDLERGEVLRGFRIDEEHWATTVLSRDGSAWAAYTRSGEVLLGATDGPMPIARFGAEWDSLESLRFAGDRAIVQAFGTLDGTPIAADANLATGNVETRPSYPLAKGVRSDEGEVLVYGDSAIGVLVLDPRSGRPLRRLHQPSRTVHPPWISSRDDRYRALMPSEFADHRGAEFLASMFEPEGPFVSDLEGLEVSRCGLWSATGDSNGYVRVFDNESGLLFRKFDMAMDLPLATDDAIDWEGMWAQMRSEARAWREQTPNCDSSEGYLMDSDWVGAEELEQWAESFEPKEQPYERWIERSHAAHARTKRGRMSFRFSPDGSHLLGAFDGGGVWELRLRHIKTGALTDRALVSAKCDVGESDLLRFVGDGMRVAIPDNGWFQFVALNGRAG